MYGNRTCVRRIVVQLWCEASDHVHDFTVSVCLSLKLIDNLAEPVAALADENILISGAEISAFDGEQGTASV